MTILNEQHLVHPFSKNIAASMGIDVMFCDWLLFSGVVRSLVIIGVILC